MPSTLQRMHHIASTADSFNRWEAGHVLAKKLMRELYHAAAQSTEVGAALLVHPVFYGSVALYAERVGAKQERDAGAAI